jgi:hypothetical protein
VAVGRSGPIAGVRSAGCSGRVGVAEGTIGVAVAVGSTAPVAPGITTTMRLIIMLRTRKRLRSQRRV